MQVDKGLNDQWVRPRNVRKTGPNSFEITVREPLGQQWGQEIIRYALPGGPWRSASVTQDGTSVPTQMDGDQLAIGVNELGPHESRTFAVSCSKSGRKANAGVAVLDEESDHCVFRNERISLRLPKSNKRIGKTVPGPIVAVRRGRGPWLGQGQLDCAERPQSVQTKVTDNGPLWTTVTVCYRFAGGLHYQAAIRLFADQEFAEVHEESNLPVRLWPAPRPYREIGSLGGSHWLQPLEKLAKPCTRPQPTSHFVFRVDDHKINRMVTHSTGSWEIMDLPLKAPSLKTYTAMRGANPFIDGGWMGVYATSGKDLVGVASLDITHWRDPDQMVHPAHRTSGASGEVFLVDSKADGSHFRFPIENTERRWLLMVTAQPKYSEKGLKAGQPWRLDPDPSHPLWTLRIRKGDLRLDKVKDWVLEWEDKGDAHPRVLCAKKDFKRIRKFYTELPEFVACYEETKHMRSADRYIMTGEKSGLQVIEDQTHAAALVEKILATGYNGPNYAIALARPLRRYVLACDVQWDSFTADEKREVRRVCALAAYILSDGDWWQYTFRPGETTYLPNFNSDVFCCAGIMGMFLTDHPCSKLWVRFLKSRMDIELKHHLRLDGGGEENIGNYLMSTWTQLLFPALWALRQTGVKDYSQDKRVLAGARFIVDIIGPQDKRDNGLRQVPCIGHHPNSRKNWPVYDWLATFLKDSAPELAAELKWIWLKTGAPVHNSYDHSGPGANPLTRHVIHHDPTIEAKQPELPSRNLPHVGALLRSHEHTAHPTFLFLKSGRVHSHHDPDEGSFHFYGRGIPLALDGLPLKNLPGDTAAHYHNQVSFERFGQPTGIVEKFVQTAQADYVRSRIAPNAYCCDANYIDDNHRSGFERELVLVKSAKPGGIEYLVVKDTVVGPDAPQWNLDVLSTKPKLKSPGHVRFPGHKFGRMKMGLDVFVVEPEPAKIELEKGIVSPKLLSAEGRKTLLTKELDYTIVEHWLMHIPAAPGSTFLTVLFPRQKSEMLPVLRYAKREETLCVEHGAGRDVFFLRSHAGLSTSLEGVQFTGRAGILSVRGKKRHAHVFDGLDLASDDYPNQSIKLL